MYIKNTQTTLLKFFYKTDHHFIESTSNMNSHKKKIKKKTSNMNWMNTTLPELSNYKSLSKYQTPHCLLFQISKISIPPLSLSLSLSKWISSNPSSPKTRTHPKTMTLPNRTRTPIRIRPPLGASADWKSISLCQYLKARSFLLVVGLSLFILFWYAFWGMTLILCTDSLQTLFAKTQKRSCAEL